MLRLPFSSQPVLTPGAWLCQVSGLDIQTTAEPAQAQWAPWGCSAPFSFGSCSYPSLPFCHTSVLESEGLEKGWLQRGYVLLCTEAYRVHLGREWLVSVRDCVRGASDKDGGGVVTGQN